MDEEDVNDRVTGVLPAQLQEAVELLRELAHEVPTTEFATETRLNAGVMGAIPAAELAEHHHRLAVATITTALRSARDDLLEAAREVEIVGTLTQDADTAAAGELHHLRRRIRTADPLRPDHRGAA